MNKLKKALLTTAAGITLSFGLATGALAQQQPQPKPGAQQEETVQQQAVSLSTITKEYNTKASKGLSALEARLNKDRPAGTPRIVFVDPDHMSAWLQAQQSSPQQYPKMVADYLASKSVTGLSPQAITTIAQVSYSMQTALFAPAVETRNTANNTAIIVPYNPNRPADAYLSDAFKVENARSGEADNTLEGLALTATIGRELMGDIVNARFAWRAFDTLYTAEMLRQQGFDQVMSRHRAEMFADLGAMMQVVKDGADPGVVTQFAAWRAAQVALTEDVRTKIFQPGEPGYYGGIVNATFPALTELKSRIDKMGVDKFRALTPTQLRDMAYDVTSKSSLSTTQATHLLGAAAMGEEYFRILQQNGVAPNLIAAAKEFVTTASTLKGQLGETAVKQGAGMSLEDVLRGLFEGHAPGEAAATPQITPWVVYDYVSSKILGDENVKKNPGSLAAHLQARAKLVDEVRDILDKNPAHADMIREMLHGVFTSDPLLRNTPPLPPQQRKPLPPLQRA